MRFTNGLGGERYCAGSCELKEKNMTKHMLKGALLVAGLVLTGCVTAPTSAQASGWRFHPERCPDLVEDVRDRRESRRDERYDFGPLDRAEDRWDRRESRRDERVLNCPASAWSWRGGARRAAAPGPVAVYYNPRKRHYYRYGPRRSRVVINIR